MSTGAWFARRGLGRPEPHDGRALSNAWREIRTLAYLNLIFISRCLEPVGDHNNRLKMLLPVAAKTFHHICQQR